MEKENNLITIPSAILIAGIIIGGAVIYTKGMPVEKIISQSTSAIKSSSINIDPVTENDHIRGTPDAPIVIVEFSDLECPFCKSFHLTMQKIMNEYGKSGKVAWVYRHFPLSIHPKAQKEALASECAYEQGGNEKFWQYVDNIFSITPSNNQLDPLQLPIIAKNIGLDVEKFNICFNSEKYDEKIQKNYQDGIRVGIGSIPETGTPYSVVIDKKGNKVPINGAQPYESVKQLIDAILAGSN
ncbi:MAG: DsbA family protein [Patescibacteria group bacterium]|nr:DsbA family protein [Patescibacteria group bacterium]